MKKKKIIKANLLEDKFVNKEKEAENSFLLDQKYKINKIYPKKNKS